jgi:hypothetical protein
VVITAQAYAAELFVSNSGNDGSGTGAINAPYATLVYALDMAERGDTITLRGGNYAGEVIVRDSNLTIRSYPGEWAKISAPVDNTDIGTCITFDFDASGCRLQRLDISGGYYYAVMFQSNWDYDESIPFAARYGASRIVIEDCRIHDSGRDCIKITPASDDITIRRCEIYRSGVGPANQGSQGTNAEGIDNVNADRMIVQDCYIHDISTTGVYGKGGPTNCVIENNLIMNCGVGGIMIGFDTDPEWFDSTANPLFYENIDGLVRNNIVVNTDGAGIGMVAALRPQVYNNTLVDVAKKFHAAIQIHYVEHYYGDDPEPRVQPSTDATIINNIVMQSAASTRPMFRITEYGLTGTLTLANNRYYNTAGAAAFKDDREADLYDGGFAGWQAHVAGETGSSEGDPMLDAAYHLASASPCINAGQNIPSVTGDYDGNLRLEDYDIGADEFDAGPRLSVPPPPTVIGTGRSTTTVASAGVGQNVGTKASMLRGSYPNPLSGSTRIAFTLERPGHVTLSVYNALGEMVSVLMDGEALSGDQAVTWDASDYPAGAYTVVMTTDRARDVFPLHVVR